MSTWRSEITVNPSPPTGSADKNMIVVHLFTQARTKSILRRSVATQLEWSYLKWEWPISWGQSCIQFFDDQNPHQNKKLEFLWCNQNCGYVIPGNPKTPWIGTLQLRQRRASLHLHYCLFLSTGGSWQGWRVLLLQTSLKMYKFSKCTYIHCGEPHIQFA